MRTPRTLLTLRRSILLMAGLLVASGCLYSIERFIRTPKFEAVPANRSIQSQKVLASEIGHRVQIVSDLGKPLGELMTIRGRWIEPPPEVYKDNPWEFVVTVVDGIKLNPPVRLKKHYLSYLGRSYAEELDPLPHPDDIKRVGSEVWELRGYEAAFYGGPPPAPAWKEYVQQLNPKVRSRPVPQAPYDSPREFGFYCHLIYVSARRISPRSAHRLDLWVLVIAATA